MRILRDEKGVLTRCIDEPDDECGGACHEYEVVDAGGETLLQLSFQKGPVGEVGVNGVQHADLLVILADRFRSFQLGDFYSTLNEVALAGVQTATAADDERTARRSLAGTEGFNRPASGVES